MARKVNQAALNSLFDADASIEGCFAGLLHLATRASHEQLFQEAVHAQAEKVSALHGRWIASLDLRNASLLRGKLGQHLATENLTTAKRFAVATGAALLTLERVLDERKLKAHRNEVSLPSLSPFESERYLLLAPPERPIVDWIDELGQQIPREPGDTRLDFAATLGLRWRLFPVDPNPLSVTVDFEDLPARVSSPLRSRLEKRRLTLGVVAPHQGLDYDFQHYPEERHAKHGTPYRFKGLGNDGAVAKGEIEDVLKRCREVEVDILVYPELTLDFDLLGHLRHQLESRHEAWPAMVIAGSFHEHAENAGYFVNRSRVFDWLGEEISRHDKLIRFRLTTSDLEKMSPDRRQELCESLGLDERGGFERIKQASHLRIVDGPLGRMSTSICLDYCGGSLDDLARHSRCNIFWVPTMSASLGDFRTKARLFAREFRAMTVVANSEWLLEVTGVPEDKREVLRSFCNLPMRGQQPAAEVDERIESLRLFRIGEIFEALRESASRPVS